MVGRLTTRSVSRARLVGRSWQGNPSSPYTTSASASHATQTLWLPSVRYIIALYSAKSLRHPSEIGRISTSWDKIWKLFVGTTFSALLNVFDKSMIRYAVTSSQVRQLQQETRRPTTRTVSDVSTVARVLRPPTAWTKPASQNTPTIASRMRNRRLQQAEQRQGRMVHRLPQDMWTVAGCGTIYKWTSFASICNADIWLPKTWFTCLLKKMSFEDV